MPPKKRTTKESTGAEPASKAGRQDNGEGPSTRNEPEDAIEIPSDDGSHDEGEGPAQPEDKDPHSYMCMTIPTWNDGTLAVKDPEAAGKPLQRKPASEHPDWRWVMMYGAWKMVVDWHLRMDYCNPENFDMYIYNDWHGYGCQELQENFLVKFNEGFSKKQKSLEAMWTVISAMLHWRLIESYEWMSHDDGERESETWGISGCAVLTMLNELDRADHLRPDSKFQDLSLVMTMALKWSADQEDYGYDEEHLEWRNSVVAYAKKAGIDLAATAPLHDAQELVDGVDEVEALGNAKADLWDWKKKFKDFEAKNGTKKRSNGKPTVGGTQYDITKMSSAERASYNFDKKDPLPAGGVPEGTFLEFRRG